MRRSDRRIDDRVRAAVNERARSIILAGWQRSLSVLLVAPPSEDDPVLDRIVAVLLGERTLVETLRHEAELRDASRRLRNHALAAAAHAHDFALVDPLEALSHGPDPTVAAAAQEAMRQQADDLHPELPLAEADHVADLALAAIGAVVREELAAPERCALDKRITAHLDQDRSSTPEPFKPLLDALAPASGSSASLALNLLEAGHLRLWAASVARTLDCAPARIEQALGLPGFAPAAARRLASDPLVAAQMLLLLARAQSADDDRAAELASAWVQVHAELNLPDAEDQLATLLRHPVYASALRRAECLA